LLPPGFFSQAVLDEKHLAHLFEKRPKNQKVAIRSFYETPSPELFARDYDCIHALYPREGRLALEF